jgi:hypothetical protein
MRLVVHPPPDDDDAEPADFAPYHPTDDHPADDLPPY